MGRGKSKIASLKSNTMLDSREMLIAELQAQLKDAKGLFAKARIKDQIEMIESGFGGTLEEYRQQKREKREAAAEDARKKAEERKAQEEKARRESEEAQKKQIEREMATLPAHKVDQFKIIQETNPMNDDYHTGIRKPSDIKTWDEVMKAKGEGDFAWGDFSREDGLAAQKSGKITIYSSYPIKDGVFVSTSRAQSEQYAGGRGKKVYSKVIPLDEVAWINGDEGQYAKVKKKSKKKA